jgi:hypothetical protein
VWDHVTIMVFENKKFSQIIGDSVDAPCLTSLAWACSYAPRTGTT